MAEANSNTTEQPKDDLNDRIAAAVAEAMKPVTQQLQTLQDSMKNEPTAEAIDKAVAERMKAQETTQEDRQALVDRITKEKLGGHPNLGKLLTGSTAEELSAQADLVAAAFKVGAPDFGGARDGGTTPAEMTGSSLGAPSASSDIGAGLRAARHNRDRVAPAAQVISQPQQQ